MTGPAVLVLEDGRTFHGRGYGATGQVFGEIVFTTGMTGYQETLTDPSYHGQVVVQTSPHIGNYGVTDLDAESRRIWVSGYVVRDPARVVSSWRAQRSLDEELQAQGVVGISEVDTRAITRHLREHGAMRVGLFSGAPAAAPVADLVAQVLASPQMAGSAHVASVTTAAPYVVPAVGQVRYRVAALDLGIKAATPRSLAERGVEVTVVGAGIDPAALLALGVDGVFLSNGPGDPATADDAVALARAVLTAGVPLFGICFGHQVLGRALGFGTYKLRYGHRGMNVPVMDRRTGRVEVTAQNHGFAVDAPLVGPTDTGYGRVEVSHVCLNDDVVEGLRCLDRPAFSVQYHPEAAAGPHDAGYLFDRFCELMEAARATT
ncbi:MAG TPA: glutamine-hydrolyzing carbamoyl-phosphate synthase small subunit [Candidatus Nanopelagicales bacterium]|nr:glutamine-hydrolyzing carbamoyl-phosphate synthase small subunit [Candidatus Nanopelagicales bacterium]